MRRAALLALLSLAACRSAAVGRPTGTDGGLDEGFASDSIFYRVAGRGSAVVLLHAFSVDSRMWEGEVRSLSAKYRVIAPDFRGHGRTPPPLASYQSHADVARVMDALGVQTAVLVGLSYGSRVAADFALAYPERVRGLVLASPTVSGFVSNDPMPFMQAVATAARAGDTRGAALAWADTPLMAIPPESGQQERLRRLVVDNARLWGMSSNPEIPLSSAATTRLADIRVPTLVLLGGADLAATRRASELLRDQVRGARLIELPTPHMINFADPMGFQRHLETFLASLRW